MKRLGLDLGSVRIGIAASDETGTLAFARSALTRKGARQDLEALKRVLATEAAQELVVGLPLNADGSEGEAARAARRFAGRLEAGLGVKVVLWDERYSTVEAATALRERGLDARAQRGLIDAEAARCVLQAYLDRQRDEELG